MRNSAARRRFRCGSLIPSTLALSAVLLFQACGGGSSSPPPPPPPPPPAAAAPSFWPLAGTYSPTQITLSDTTAASTIYYTTDGSTPTASSTLYTGPVTVSSTTTVKAIATASGFSASAVASATYTVPAQGVSGPAVSVVLTTDDQSRKMQPQSATGFTTASASGNIIYVDETQTYQPIEGFGAAFTDSAAYLLNEVAQKPALATTMNDLFTRTGNGIGLSFMRTPMGASDIARTQYSYDDNNGVGRSHAANFSVAHDVSRRDSHHPASPHAQSADEADGESVVPAGLDEDIRLHGRRRACNPPCTRPSPDIS